MNEYSLYWDNKVKKLAQEVIEKSTVDERMINYYVGKMIFAVEHDLADRDGMGLMSLNNVLQVSSVFSDESYFQKIHKNTPKKEIERMKNLSKELKILMDKWKQK